MYISYAVLFDFYERAGKDTEAWLRGEVTAESILASEWERIIENELRWFINNEDEHILRIKTKIEQAKESGDQMSVNTILQRFIKLKKQMTRGLL